jgi:hypothetical protein
MTEANTTGTTAPSGDRKYTAEAQAAQEPVFYREAPEGRFLVYVDRVPGKGD